MFLLAVVAGIGLGPVQSSSRSLFGASHATCPLLVRTRPGRLHLWLCADHTGVLCARLPTGTLIPKGLETEFYGFYAVTDRIVHCIRVSMHIGSAAVICVCGGSFPAHQIGFVVAARLYLPFRCHSTWCSTCSAYGLCILSAAVNAHSQQIHTRPSLVVRQFLVHNAVVAEAVHSSLYYVCALRPRALQYASHDFAWGVCEVFTRGGASTQVGRRGLGRWCLRG